MKLASTLVAALVAMGGAATASTLSITSIEVAFQTAGGVNLDSTFSVTGGWYDTALGFADYATVATNFVSAGSVAFPYAGNAAYNGFAAGTTDFFNSNTLGIEGDNIFWLVSDGSTGWALLENVGNTFVNENLVPNTNVAELTTANIGSWTVHVGDASGAPGNIKLAVIPEPSAALLGGLGALGLLRRRRN